MGITIQRHKLRYLYRYYYSILGYDELRDSFSLLWSLCHAWYKLQWFLDVNTYYIGRYTLCRFQYYFFFFVVVFFFFIGIPQTGVNFTNGVACVIEFTRRQNTLYTYMWYRTYPVRDIKVNDWYIIKAIFVFALLAFPSKRGKRKQKKKKRKREWERKKR